MTNDDGVDAPGLLSLIEALYALGEVIVVAPDRNWSASGHTKAMHKPLRVEKRTLRDGSPAYAAEGARRLTDDAIQDIMEFARDIRTGIDEADFDTKQKIFELLDVQANVDGDKSQVSCAIANSISQKKLPTKPLAGSFFLVEMAGIEPASEEFAPGLLQA